ncbi:hypothetical protein B0H14DRAFT_3439891 [Mycena olivaceomarginata]|nr:hypothetical protein B0H14DRAFT_3439891 [Mycena olivaceomarginata]
MRRGLPATQNWRRSSRLPLHLQRARYPHEHALSSGAARFTSAPGAHPKQQRCTLTLASPAMLGTTAPSFGPSVFQLTGTHSPSVMLQPARRRVVSRLPSTARAPRFKLYCPAQGEHRSSRGKSSPVTLHPAHRRDSRSRLNLPQRAEGLPHQHTSPYFVHFTAHDALGGSAPPSTPPGLARWLPDQQTEGAALLPISLYRHPHCGRTQRTSFQCTLRPHTRAVANTIRTSERKPVALLPASLYHHPRRRGTQPITLHPAPIMEADVVRTSDRKVVHPPHPARRGAPPSFSTHECMSSPRLFSLSSDAAQSPPGPRSVEGHRTRPRMGGDNLNEFLPAIQHNTPTRDEESDGPGLCSRPPFPFAQPVARPRPGFLQQIPADDINASGARGGRQLLRRPMALVLRS